MPTHRENQPRAERARNQAEEPLRLQDFSVTELTKALGCPRANEMEVTGALVDLCKTAAIRFGLPETARETTSALVNAPSHEALASPTPGVPSDPRWERLANCVATAGGAGAPVVLRLPSHAALEGLKEAVASLHTEVKDLRLKSISEQTAAKLKHSIDEVHRDALKTPATKEESLNAYRQLKIYHEVSPEWAKVTPLEHFFLVGCTLPEAPPNPPAEQPRPSQTKKPVPDKADRPPQPDAKILAPFQLKWVFSQKTHRWGPSTYESKYKNSTLFDLAAKYLTTLFRNPLRPKTEVFLKELLKARETYEEPLKRGEYGSITDLRAAQKKAFKKLLSE